MKTFIALFALFLTWTVQANPYETSVRCWGGGQTVNVPADLQNPRGLTVGGHACVLTDTGVRCWGKDLFGQTRVPFLRRPTQVSASSETVGGAHSCALTDIGISGHGIKCWGSNYYAGFPAGQLDVPPDLRDLVQVVTGYAFTCGLSTSSGVRCWGNDFQNRHEVPNDLKNPQRLSAHNSVCALTDTGLRCWGPNSYGQNDVPDDLGNVQSFSLGALHTCAIADGQARCWGLNSLGQTDVPPLDEPTLITAGHAHTCALEKRGSVRCWGSNSSGQSDVPEDLGKVVELEAGVDTCAVVEN